MAGCLSGYAKCHICKATTEKTIFECRYGSHVIEVAKGKTGIEIDALEELPAIIELVMKAVDAGELDEGIMALAGAFGRQVKKPTLPENRSTIVGNGAF